MHPLKRKIEDMAMHAYAMCLIIDVLKKGDKFFGTAAAMCPEFKRPSAESVRRLLEGASLWLDCAARMETIQFGLSFDEGPLWCRSAYEYEMRKGKTQSVFLSTHMRFHLLWNALEIVGGLLFPSDSQHGKTNVRKMIDHMGRIHFDGTSLLKIKETLLSYQDVLKQMDAFKHSSKFENSDLVIHSLHMTKFLRNRYIHGGAYVPNSDFYKDCPEHEIPPELNGYIAACRTTLLWMQALLIDVANKTRCQMKTTITNPDTGRDKDVQCMFSTFLAKQHYRLFPGSWYGDASLWFCDLRRPKI